MSELHIIPALKLECGTILRRAPVAYATWGHLNASGDNTIIVCHALTGSPEATDWWSGLIGPGLVLDTDRYFVVCANVLGSPYGSASPLTLNPDTGRPYGADFPTVTIRDTVSAHRALLEHLGVRQVAIAIGGSMGGMQALEWAFHGSYVRTIAPLAIGGRHSAWCIGWSEAQRQAIYTDPLWQDGRYDLAHPPANGLATARMMAMISYRAPEEFSDRFGRERARGLNGNAPFEVESYLRYQGDKLVRRFDPNCYVRLTQQMDTHDLARGRGSYPEVLATIKQPALVFGVTSDVLYPLSEQKTLAAHLPNGTLGVLEAPFGHDSFLIEQPAIARLLEPWMAQHLAPLPALPSHP